MPEQEQGMDLGDLIDDEDLLVLEEEAKRRGLTLAETAKFGMQRKLRERTRPKSMTGTIQAFRRKD
ncbi:hypothetical protein NPS29_16710 [Pseudomonas putida]|uniref:hypothetical protein n=1 Tax=Pseudomonas putida TaxID=303 RepID=UPI0023642E1B|nr:hypothetical protein [Pseudomonas putida]MDD1966972.1 hypothetical protein [Pseudomonas putida]